MVPLLTEASYYCTRKFCGGFYLRDYPRVFDALVDAGDLETSPYLVDVQSMGYRLAGRFDGDKCKVVPAQYRLGIRKIQSELERMHRQREQDQRASWLPIHWTLKDMMRMLTIDDEVDAELDRLPSNTRLRQLVRIGDIRRNEHHFSVGPAGRCFTSFTGRNANSVLIFASMVRR